MTRRTSIFATLLFVLLSCSQGKDHSYKPGLGEFMTSIQIHHAKLWFAGKAQNWELADFEMHEISEDIDNIRAYCSERPEIVSLAMIDPALSGLSSAIKQKNDSLFSESYLTLTNSCNSCHRTTNHAFNVVKIPDTPPFSNQEFKRR
jgi:hypothetical protein